MVPEALNAVQMQLAEASNQQIEHFVEPMQRVPKQLAEGCRLECKSGHLQIGQKHQKANLRKQRPVVCTNLVESYPVRMH